MHELPANTPDAEASLPEPTPKSPRKGRLLGCGISLAILFVLFALMLPGIRTASPEARRMACLTNLLNIGQAVHQYHEKWGALPPAYTVDTTGQPLHSWRTLILPYLGQQKLYNKIDLTKAWDDPINAEARQTPLSFYNCSEDPDQETHTNYIAIVGEDFAFAPTRPRPMSEITDGLTQTIMVIEAPRRQTWEWMAPRDGGKQQFLNAFQRHQNGINVVFCDGHCSFLHDKMPQETRRALMTIAGDDILKDENW